MCEPIAVFRVFEIKDTEFVERDNIRTGKNSNLNFSCNDASWNPVDGESYTLNEIVMSLLTCLPATEYLQNNGWQLLLQMVRSFFGISTSRSG